MSYRQITAQRLDIIIGARILNGCWFITSVGIAVFQMRLLAQVWQETHQAIWTACIVSSWMLGSVLISRLDARKLRAPRLWGVSFVICSFIWLDVSPSLHLFSLPFHFTIVVGLGALILMAWLLGMMSTAWLAQRRPWPPVDERIALAKGLMSTMIGLCVVWVFPAWAGSLGLACLSPLLVLDFWPQAQCPLPLPGKVVDSWYDTSAGAERWQVQLRRRRLPLSWWWSYLTQRGYVSLIFLASSVSVILGGLWSAVPTPFASGLAGTHAAW